MAPIYGSKILLATDYIDTGQRLSLSPLASPSESAK